jgi:glycosyltransferase involved in cell wall biosynthesis
VYNVHDLQHVHYPDFFSEEDLLWKEKTFRAGCERAHTVVAITEWVKQDIVEHYQTDPQRIQVIYWAPPTQVHALSSPVDVEALLLKHAISSPFALFPSMTRVHKNHIRLLEAIASLRDEHALKIELVCTGNKNEFWPIIEQRLVSLRLQDQVKFLGMVRPGELRALYARAEFVVFPSLFEGAGMPLLESWQDNVPVTCSGVTSLPEMAGDAALLFDPNSVQSIADALAKMHTNRDLREEFRRRGAKRLLDFSWDRTARHYRAVFRHAGGLQLNDEDRYLLNRTKNVPTRESV